MHRDIVAQKAFPINLHKEVFCDMRLPTQFPLSIASTCGKNTHGSTSWSWSQGTVTDSSPDTRQPGTSRVYATRGQFSSDSGGPHIQPDIVWFFFSHDSATFARDTDGLEVRIPPTVTTPASISKIYIDTSIMPGSQGFQYIVQGRCSVCTWPEFDVKKWW